MKQIVKIGKVQSEDFIFCGLSIQKEERNLKIYSKEIEDIEPFHQIPVGDQKFMPLTTEEEKKVRSIIGSLQWAATANRPDLSNHLATALGRLNKNNDRQSIIDANNLLLKYAKYEGVQLNIVPMDLEKVVIETHGDSAFQISNQQGIVCMLRETADSDKVNFISWRSKRAERRTWSTLAAETHALQKALDESIHMKCVLAELRIRVHKNIVVTDNLSLRRVIYSGRPVQEDRLKKEF